MKAVINSSPLIALGCINKIDILTEVSSEVLIPQEVYNETVVNGKNTNILNAVKANVFLRMCAGLEDENYRRNQE